MSEIDMLRGVLDRLGVKYLYEANEDGWGLPEYRETDADWPPPVQQVVLGCSTLYFDKKEGTYLGWYNSEFSDWNERKKA